MQTIAQYVTDAPGGGDSSDGGFQYTGVAQVHHVEDGDTFYGAYRADPTITVAKPASKVAPEGVSQDGQWHRLVKIDTAETGADSEEQRQKAKQHKQFVEDFVTTARENHTGNWPFTIAYTGQDYEGSFGRELTDLIRRSDGRSLTAALLDEFGEAVRYQSSG